MFRRWLELQATFPFARFIGPGDDRNRIEPSDRLGDLPLDRFDEGDVNVSWVFSNIWDASRERWIIGKDNSETAVDPGVNRRMPASSWNDIPQFRFETNSSEIRKMFAGEVIRTGSQDEFTSAKEAFARDCFLWSISDGITSGNCDVIPSCWAATPVETTVLNVMSRSQRNMCESVTEQILMFTELREGEERHVKSPRFLVLNAEGFDKEVDKEGVVWQEGRDSCYTWRISSDSPFSRASGMNTATPERSADREFRGAVSLMNCIKCLLCFGNTNVQDYGQVSLWLENEGRWLADLVLNETIQIGDGYYKVCVTKQPMKNRRINAEGTEIDYVYILSVKENMINSLKMSEEGLKGVNDSRRAKLNAILEEVMTVKGSGELHGWLSKHIYDYVSPSFIDDRICYNGSPFRVLEMVEAGLVQDRLDVVQKLFNGDIVVLSDEEREADHMGVLGYDHSEDRMLLSGGFKGHKISWRHETLKLFVTKQGAIAIRREGTKLRSNHLGVLAAIYRVVHDTGAVEVGLESLRWERVNVNNEPETQIVLNSLLSGRLGVGGFTWGIAFLRDSGIRLTADSACYLKQFHATDGGGEFTVRQILKSSVLRRLEAVEFTTDGERCIGLDFDLPDTILRIDERENDADVVRRRDCSAMVKGRITSRFFVGGTTHGACRPGANSL